MKLFMMDMGLALATVLGYAGSVLAPIVLCVFIAGCMIAALAAHGSRFDGLDRLIFCGVAISTIAMIPSLVPPHLWGKDWSIGFFLLCLSALFGRRFLIPALIALKYKTLG